MTTRTAVLAFLHDDELREIVMPLRQPAAIVRWFRRQGFAVRVKPNGMPLVSRANFDAVMNSCSAVRTAPALDISDASNTPNIGALLRLFRKNANNSDGSHKKKR